MTRTAPTASATLLLDGFDRVSESVHAAVEGLSDDQLTFRAGPDANTIAWLVWHLTRIQDDHVAAAAGTDQQWTAAGWAGRFALPFDDKATGYGQSSDEVAAVRASADQLAGYHEAVHEATARFVEGLSDADLDRVVDSRWDPPVTLGVRLVSVITDDLQHVGQAAYVRGLAERA
jgi:uncharacterized damage-inducible protein DinB